MPFASSTWVFCRHFVFRDDLPNTIPRQIIRCTMRPTLSWGDTAAHEEKLQIVADTTVIWKGATAFQIPSNWNSLCETGLLLQGDWYNLAVQPQITVIRWQRHRRDSPQLLSPAAPSAARVWILSQITWRAAIFNHNQPKPRSDYFICLPVAMQ